MLFDYDLPKGQVKAQVPKWQYMAQSARRPRAHSHNVEQPWNRVQREGASEVHRQHPVYLCDDRWVCADFVRQ